MESEFRMQIKMGVLRREIPSLSYLATSLLDKMLTKPAF
jgi:hypothetical protein